MGITQTQKDEVIRRMMEDFPEASSSSMLCVGYRYKEMEFDFIEDDEKTAGGIKHHVNMAKLRQGFNKLIQLALEGKYNNYKFPAGIFGKNADWDAADCDALVQCAVLGDVIYG